MVTDRSGIDHACLAGKIREKRRENTLANFNYRSFGYQINGK